MAGKGILFIGHEGTRTGAPMVLLHLLRWLRANTDLRMQLLLLRDGALRADYAQLVPTRLPFGDAIADPSQIPGLRKIGRFLMRRLLPFRSLPDQIGLVYANTIASADGLRAVHDPALPVLVHVHELQGIINRFRRDFELLRPRATHYIAASEPVRRNLVDSERIPAGRIEVVPEFIDAQGLQRIDTTQMRQRLREELGLPRDAVLVGAIGNADARKGADLFAQVVEHMLPHVGREVVWVWVGVREDAPSNQEMLRLWKASPAWERIRRLPNRPDAVQCAAALDFLLLPSREDPFPLVVLEAAAVGVPTICFEGAGGMPSFVADECGLAVPYLDVRAMAEAALETLACPQRRQTWGGRAREKVLREFDVTVQAPRILQAITRHL